MLHGGEGGRELQQSDVSGVRSTRHHHTSTVTPHCMQRVITHLMEEGGREGGGERWRDGGTYTRADSGYKEGGSESGCVMCKAHVAVMGSGGILHQKCNIETLGPLVAPSLRSGRHCLSLRVSKSHRSLVWTRYLTIINVLLSRAARPAAIKQYHIAKKMRKILPSSYTNVCTMLKKRCGVNLRVIILVIGIYNSREEDCLQVFSAVRYCFTRKILI